MLRPGATAVRQRVVLVVDDESVVRSVERDILELAGCMVLEAATADEALALAAGHPGTIDVLVTDLTLPGLRGDGLAERLLAARPGLGVIFTSGYAECDAPCEHFPGSLFLQKPFSLDALAAAVDAVAC